MRALITVILPGVVTFAVSIAGAQPPGRPDDGRSNGQPAADASTFITRMMTFDANQDGKLSRDEVTDARLVSLFDRADANQDGFATKDELTSVYNKESATSGGGPGGGFGPPGRGPGGPGGMGGPPPIGQVLSPHFQDMLKLSQVQKKKIEALQKLVDNKLDQILNEDQKQQLEGMRHRGPGGPDGDRGRFGPPVGGGPGGNRGGPPGDRGRPQRPPTDQTVPEN
jgi:hypothetical protein